MQRALLILLVVVSYLLLAGGRAWTLGPLLGLATLAALSAPRRTFTAPAEHRVLDLSLLAVCAGLVLQLTPLPVAVVNAISPNAALARSSGEFVSLSPAARRWTTISLDPAATLEALATVALAILAFWTARAMFSAGGNTRVFCRTLAALGAAAAVAAILQKSLTPKLVLFVVQPEARSASPFGAFLNRNHMAAWLLMVACPVAGYLIAQQRIHQDSRASWRTALKRFMVSGAMLTAIALTIIIGVLLLTLSRSAVVGLGVGALAACYVGRHRLQMQRTSVPAALGTLGAMVIAATLFVDINGWATRLQESVERGPSELGRISIWRETVPIVQDFWLVGSGAGSFSVAMTQYQQSRVWMGSMQRWARINNAHSHYLQLAAEGGLLLAIPTAMGLFALVRLGVKALQAEKAEMFWIRAGAAASLVGIAVQSIWEVSLIMPANAVLCAALAGLLLHRRT